MEQRRKAVPEPDDYHYDEDDTNSTWPMMSKSITIFYRSIILVFNSCLVIIIVVIFVLLSLLLLFLLFLTRNRRYFLPIFDIFIATITFFVVIILGIVLSL